MTIESHTHIVQSRKLVFISGLPYIDMIDPWLILRFCHPIHRLSVGADYRRWYQNVFFFVSFYDYIMLAALAVMLAFTHAQIFFMFLCATHNCMVSVRYDKLISYKFLLIEMSRRHLINYMTYKWCACQYSRTHKRQWMSKSVIIPWNSVRRVYQ